MRVLAGLVLALVAAGCRSSASSSGYPTVNGIPCETSERITYHVHAHLATVPYGIGIGQPWRDFFAIWGQPLPTGSVVAYVNGERYTGDPAEIPLEAHALLQLDVDDTTPPQPFTFPPGL